MLEQQSEWQRLYRKQLEQGGIIDLEAERVKYRLPALPSETAGRTAAKQTEVGLHHQNLV